MENNDHKKYILALHGKTKNYTEPYLFLSAAGP